MSIPLIDFRGKVTPETQSVLEALARTTGRTFQDIAREWMHEKAMEHIHAASVLHGLLKAQGLKGIDGGRGGEAEVPRGNARERGGSRRGGDPK
jgi:hypothetical protein